MRKAVFLDLQGTLGGDGLGDVVDFSFFPFSVKAIKMLNDFNMLAIVVTNQSHISKGYFTYEEFNRKINELKDELKQKDAYLDAVYCCPHTKEDKCKCKKPLPGMILKAQEDFNINIKESYVIGDMGADDMLLADSVGAKGILVRTGVGEGSLTNFRNTWKDVKAEYIADDVFEAVKWILEKETK